MKCMVLVLLLAVMLIGCVYTPFGPAIPAIGRYYDQEGGQWADIEEMPADDTGTVIIIIYLEESSNE